METDQTEGASIFGGGDTRSKGDIDNAQRKTLASSKDVSNSKPEPGKNDITQVTTNQKEPATQTDQYAIHYFDHNLS